MKLFFYYMTHTLKNAIKKLFKTWVLIFLLIMIIGGVLVGLLLGSALDNVDPSQPDSQQSEEFVPVIPENDTPENAPLKDILEIAAGGVILLMFVMNVMGADKSGADIFLPADVNLLFPSPMKPQSVLLFRTVTQMGVSLLFTLYILCFQVPNLINSGLDAGVIITIVIGWILTLCVAQLLRMLCFVIASTHPGFKQNLRRGVYAVLLLMLGGYALYKTQTGLNWWDAAVGYFNAPATRFIPFWGWIKGFVIFSAEGNALYMWICLAATVVCSVVLAWVIWHMKADFYEDALQKATAKAELIAAAQSSENGVALLQRKKDRSDRIRRNEFDRGWGANVFFHKAVYNRFRFAHLHFFTKTLELYLAIAVGVAIFCRFVIVTASPLPVVLALAMAAFFRSLGNSLKEDTRMWFFRMIPEQDFSKLGWSLLGDLFNCLMDALPALILGLVIQGAPVHEGLLWLPVVLSVTAYATIVGTFIELSVNVNAGKTIKQMVQVVFIYFGLLPDVGLLVLFMSMGLPIVAALAVIGVNTALTLLFLYLSSLSMGTK